MSKCRAAFFLLVKVINKQFIRDYNFKLKKTEAQIFHFRQKSAKFVLRGETILQDHIVRP